MEHIYVDTRMTADKENWTFAGSRSWHRDHMMVIYPPVWLDPAFDRNRDLVPDLYCYDLAKEDHAFLMHDLEDVDISVEYMSMYSSVVHGGIIFRAQDSSRFYVLDIFDKARKGQNYELTLWVQDKYGYRHEIARGSALHSIVPEHIIQEGAKTRTDWDMSSPDWFRIRIQASGTYIRVSADGKTVFDLRDSTYRSGYTGLTARGPVLFRSLAVEGTKGSSAGLWKKHEGELPRFFCLDEGLDEGFNAYPAVCRGDDGKVYAVWSYTSAKEYHSFGNNIVFCISEDNGITWSDPKIIYTTDRKETICHPSSVYAHLDGSISCLVNIWEEGHILIRSINGGLSWTDEGPFTVKSSNRKDGVRVYLYSPMRRLSDGTVIMTAYEADETRGMFASVLRDRSLLLTSKDDGHTWGEASYFDENNFDHNECMVIESGPGELIAFMRSLRAPNMWKSRSDDGGRTWSMLVQTDISGECPFLIMHSSGSIVMFNRENGVFIKTSRDGGLSWTKETRISPASAMIGMVEVDDGKILIVMHEGYRMPGHIRGQFFRAALSGLEPA